jgi:hypothetical protein
MTAQVKQLNEALGRGLRYGAYDAEVLDRLRCPRIRSLDVTEKDGRLRRAVEGGAYGPTSTSEPRAAEEA